MPIIVNLAQKDFITLFLNELRIPKIKKMNA
jgi:hypothetical protein